MNYTCPDVQMAYHADLMPLLLRLMVEESQIKMKAQVVSCAVSFVVNLTGRPGSKDEVDAESAEAGKQLISQYSPALVQSISVLF